MTVQANAFRDVRQSNPTVFLRGTIRESGSDPRSLAGRPTDRSKLLGQVFTPDFIAERMARELLPRAVDRQIQLLDPCVGPSTFPKHIVSAVGQSVTNVKMTLLDLDESMIASVQEWAVTTRLVPETICGDYLEIPIDGRFDCAILNPPYIRQEWIANQESYRERFKA